ncbi:hypothetical protein TWF506_005772 [Arthrobotrys conoides]|uniref:C2H2-type domain-containing protein n=1 Tax=Arthrobotrys conoides TaxID=74498 RepID=A0AAN8RQ34_9PEZI
MDNIYYSNSTDPARFNKITQFSERELYGHYNREQIPSQVRPGANPEPFYRYRNNTGFYNPSYITPATPAPAPASQYDVMLDKMDQNNRQVFFGDYNGEQSPSNKPTDFYFGPYSGVDLLDFSEFRSNDIDEFSSDGITLDASEYNTSFGTTETNTTLYSPVENLNEIMGLWPNIGPGAGDLDPNILEAIVGEFRNRSSIVSARPSPNLAPQLDLEDIEGVYLEALTVGNPKGVATTTSPAEGCSPSMLDKLGKERFKKLKRSLDKYSEILDASGSESQEDQEGERTISANRGRERPRVATAFENQQNPQSTRSRRTPGRSRDTSQKDYSGSGNAVPLASDTSLPSQENHRRQRMSHADKDQVAPQKRSRPAQAFRQLEPRSTTHHIQSVTETTYPRAQRRDALLRPKNGEFRCTINGCTRQYNRSENLCRHIRTDHRTDHRMDDVRLTCPECGAKRNGGRAQENMNTHRREKHGVIIHV